MILVTLGTQDKQFDRLLRAVQKAITDGTIKDKVVVQAGYTKFNSTDMEIFDLIDREKFSQLIGECDLLITHGGVGSILTGLKNNKKIIACSRLAKYQEHINDHQRQIVDKFFQEGYLLKYDEGDDLSQVIVKSSEFIPKPFKSNNAHFINIIEKFIDEN
ncbi:MAG: PssE/Cps14G family polysaccharide biosynthesis glycosyltransferase [Erysipelotrichia bacterium]|nr:PssE/Cps14G family polysaccharide biosynthesis glycosyltransferase [Erysipelotrichia bacterium]